MLLLNAVKLNALDNISISSAGTHAYNGNPPDPKMVDYLSEIGVPIEMHEARKITKDIVDWADRILVMEKYHAEIIESHWPEAKSKIDRLGQYISNDQWVDDIIDPYGRSLFHYRLAWSQITMAIKNIVKKILSDQNAQNQIHSR